MLLIGLTLTVIWTVFGRVDVVASAPGTLIPTGNIKLVQSPGTGVVRAIYVRNGDFVRKDRRCSISTRRSSAPIWRRRKRHWRRRNSTWREDVRLPTPCRAGPQLLPRRRGRRPKLPTPSAA